MVEAKVRRARRGDHAALVKIYRQGIEAIHPERPAPVSWTAEYERETAGECVLAAEWPGAGVVGMLSIWEEDAFIHHLYVDARYRRRGVGSRLLREVTKGQAGPFRLKCLMSNAAALAFYSRMGWREVGKEGAPEGDSVLLEFFSKPSGGGV